MRRGPIYEYQKKFELLLLENFQAGLIWITILRRREIFRQVFDNFDYKIIANYSEIKLETVRNNSEIIRKNRKLRRLKPTQFHL